MGASAGAEQTSGGLIAYAVLVAADNVLDGGQSGKRMSLAHPVAALPGSRREIRLLQGGDMYCILIEYPLFPRRFHIHVFGGSGEFCFHMFSECLSFSSVPGDVPRFPRGLLMCLVDFFLFRVHITEKFLFRGKQIQKSRKRADSAIRLVGAFYTFYTFSEIYT